MYADYICTHIYLNVHYIYVYTRDIYSIFVSWQLLTLTFFPRFVIKYIRGGRIERSMEVYLPEILGNYETQTDQPIDRPTNGQTGS